MSTNSVSTAPAAVTHQSPAPVASPTAALVHSAAAVVIPRTEPRSRMIAPAPMKPMPEAICAATRIGSTLGPRASSGNPCAPDRVKIAAPAATSACVRMPASWLRDSRSRPIRAPQAAAAPMRRNASAASIGIALSIPAQPARVTGLREGSGRRAPILRRVEARDHLAVGREELVLVGPDVLHEQLVDAGALVLLERLDGLPEIRAAGHRLGDHVLGDELGGLLEVSGRGQHLRELARQLLVRPYPVGDLARLALVVGEAHLGAGLHRPLAALAAVEPDQLGIRRGGAVAVADSRRHLRGLRAEPGDEDRRRLVRQVVDARVLHCVVLAREVAAAALPQLADHGHRLLEHLEPGLDGRPAV